MTFRDGQMMLYSCTTVQPRKRIFITTGSKQGIHDKESFRQILVLCLFSSFFFSLFSAFFFSAAALAKLVRTSRGAAQHTKTQ
jgi:hypothetical protein